MPNKVRVARAAPAAASLVAPRRARSRGGPRGAARTTAARPRRTWPGGARRFSSIGPRRPPRRSRGRSRRPCSPPATTPASTCPPSTRAWEDASGTRTRGRGSETGTSRAREICFCRAFSGASPARGGSRGTRRDARDLRVARLEAHEVVLRVRLDLVGRPRPHVRGDVAPGGVADGRAGLVAKHLDALDEEGVLVRRERRRGRRGVRRRRRLRRGLDEHGSPPRFGARRVRRARSAV